MTRYLGSTNTKEVHDLRNEQADCKIVEIEIEHRVNFRTLKAAHDASYVDCPWCIGGSERQPTLIG